MVKMAVLLLLLLWLLFKYKFFYSRLSCLANRNVIYEAYLALTDRKCIHRFWFCLFFEMISVCSFHLYVLEFWLPNFYLKWTDLTLCIHRSIGTIGNTVEKSPHSRSFFFSDFLWIIRKMKEYKCKRCGEHFISGIRVVLSFQQKAT